MLQLIRKHQYGIMLFVAIIVIIAFTLWGEFTTPKAGGPPTGEELAFAVGEKQVTLGEYRDFGRVYGLAYDLRLQQMIDVLTYADARYPARPGRMPADFALNLAFLREKKKELGIQISDEEIEESIKNIPSLQTNGQFDPRRWEMMEKVMEAQGFTTREFYDVIGDSITVSKVVNLVSAGAEPSPEAVERLYEQQYSSMTGSLYRFASEKHEGKVEVKDEEISEYYENNKHILLTDEQRKIRYAFFKELSGLEDIPLEERILRQKEYNAKVNDFSVAVLEPGADFAAISEEKGVELLESDLFAMGSEPEGFAEEFELVGKIFSHKVETGASDPVKGKAGYYVFEVTEVVKPRGKTLEEARETVVEALEAQKVNEAVLEEANGVREKLMAAVKSGGDIAAVAEAAGVTPVVVKDFSFAVKPVKDREVVQMSAGLEAGEFSETMPEGDGAAFFYLATRALKEDPMKEDRMATMRDALKREDTFSLVDAWFRLEKDKLELVLPKPEEPLGGGGGVAG